MTNSWSLLYDEIYGDESMTDNNRVTPQESDEYDPIHITTSDPNINIGTIYSVPPNLDTTDYITGIGTDQDLYLNTNSSSFATCSDGITIGEMAGTFDLHMPENNDPWIYESPDGGETVTRRKTGSLDKEVIKTSSIKDPSNRKYKEDESIKSLQDYISTTYGGHYTSKENNVQTLDLIESVGDAESFCRSNAIKYLSRYDKKGQAKRDILKALHYSLLLYHFSGQLNETTTRGYETF